MPAFQRHLNQPPALAGAAAPVPVCANSPMRTLSEAAEWLRISPRQLHKKTQDGEIACVRIGRSVRYDQKDLEAFIVANKSGGRASKAEVRP